MRRNLKTGAAVFAGVIGLLVIFQNCGGSSPSSISSSTDSTTTSSDSLPSSSDSSSQDGMTSDQKSIFTVIEMTDMVVNLRAGAFDQYNPGWGLYPSTGAECFFKFIVFGDENSGQVTISDAVRVAETGTEDPDCSRSYNGTVTYTRTGNSSIQICIPTMSYCYDGKLQ